MKIIRFNQSLMVSILLILCTLTGSSQTNLKPITHYLFSEFNKGIVLMKNGTKNEALLNYNSLTEEMIFDNRGMKLALGQVDLIDTVSILNRKFIPYENSFLELVDHSKYALFVKHKCKIVDPGKPAGYGTTSQTSAITTYSKFFTNGRVYDMSLPEGVATQSSIEYFLLKDGVLEKFISIRQLEKLFPLQKSQMKVYLKKNDVSYEDQGSIITLLHYLEVN